MVETVHMTLEWEERRGGERDSHSWLTVHLVTQKLASSGSLIIHFWWTPSLIPRSLKNGLGMRPGNKARWTQ